MIAAELEKLSHYVCIQQRAFDTNLRARRERRIAVLRNDPRYPARQTALLHITKRVREQVGRARQLRRYRFANFVERIPLERKERIIIRAPVPFQIIQKASQPGAVTQTNPARRIGGNDLLKARTAQFQIRINPMNRISPLEVERTKILGRNVLAVRLFAQLDPIKVVTPGAQITNLVRGVLWFVVKQTSRQEHAPTICQPVLEDSIKARLLDTWIQIGFTMPGIGG